MFSRSKQALETQAAIAAELHSVPEDSPAQINTENEAEAQTREKQPRGDPFSAISLSPTGDPDLAEEAQYPDEEINAVTESDSDISDLEDEADHGPAPYHTEAPRPTRCVQSSLPEPSGYPDMIFIRSRGFIYPLHFDEYAIDESLVTVGMLRIAAASKLKLSSPNNLRLLYKGNMLKDDNMPCKLEGIKHRSQILCAISKSEEHESSASDTEPESRYRKNKVPLKPKVRVPSSRTPRHNSPIRDTIEPDPFHFEESPLFPEDVNFKLLPPMEQVNRITEDFDTHLVPLCNEFLRAPPIDENKRQNEYRAVSERILESVLLRVDNVDTRGDPNVRIARKNLINRAQGVLNELERAARPSR